MRKKRIAILGSTGSIGINTLNVVAQHPDKFEVVLLTAWNNHKCLSDQIQRFTPSHVALAPGHVKAMRAQFSRVKFFDAVTDIPDLVMAENIDIVVIAIVGAAALDPFLSAVKTGKTVAPANKEALVMAGELIMNAAKRYNSLILPVDSEQSAIFQCLSGQRCEDLKKVHLTASGGALLNMPLKEYSKVSVHDVLKHPRWKMGRKITVDSATLMNKGFEIIEAQRLFGLTADQINVVIHPEAYIHSLVEYVDGSMLAQLSVTDMRIPIQYALTYPERLPTGFSGLDLGVLRTLHFDRPDLKKFPALQLSYDVAKLGGTSTAVLNAADEVAVAAFLDEKLSFSGIFRLIEKVLCANKNIINPSLPEIKEADKWAREAALSLLGKTR